MKVFSSWQQVSNELDDFHIPASLLSACSHLQRTMSIDFTDCFSKGQLYSKYWLLKEGKYYLEESEKIVVCGSWFSQLPFLLLKKYNRLRCIAIDIDARAIEIGNILNYENIPRYSSRCIDMSEFKYDSKVNLIINTSCEHVADLHKWRNQIPAGKWLIAQSNNNTSIPDHVNCASSIEHFQEQLNLSEVWYADEIVFPDYTRYMVIGQT